MKQKLWVNIFFGITLCFGVGYIASMATQISVSTWYKALEKPFFTPPSWIFAPVWSLLYFLMGIALGRAIFVINRDKLDKNGLYYFIGQLLFNGLWSVFFFGLKNPTLGLLTIILSDKSISSSTLVSLDSILISFIDFFKSSKACTSLTIIFLSISIF